MLLMLLLKLDILYSQSWVNSKDTAPEPTELAVYQKFTANSKLVTYSILIINIPVLDNLDRITVYKLEKHYWKTTRTFENTDRFAIATIKNKRKSYPLEYMVEIVDNQKNISTILNIVLYNSKTIGINNTRVFVNRE